MAKEKGKQKKGARRWAFPLGLLITILSVVGIVTILVAGISATKKAVQKGKNFDEYNQLLVPVIMNDPDAFDDVTKAKPNQLLDIAIWSIIKAGLSPEEYEYSDRGILVPEADVTAVFHKLFGPEVEPEHASVEGYNYDFEYDAAKQVYVIPLTGVTPLYTPKVVSTEKKHNAVVITVAYLAGDQWHQDDMGKMVEPEPEKYMRVTLRKVEDAYYISALQNTSALEIASSNPTKAPETEVSETEVTEAETLETEVPSENIESTAEENVMVSSESEAA